MFAFRTAAILGLATLVPAFASAAPPTPVPTPTPEAPSWVCIERFETPLPGRVKEVRETDLLRVVLAGRDPKAPGKPPSADDPVDEEGGVQVELCNDESVISSWEFTRMRGFKARPDPDKGRGWVKRIPKAGWPDGTVIEAYRVPLGAARALSVLVTGYEMSAPAGFERGVVLIWRVTDGALAVEAMGDWQLGLDQAFAWSPLDLATGRVWVQHGGEFGTGGGDGGTHDEVWFQEAGTLSKGLEVDRKTYVLYEEGARPNCTEFAWRFERQGSLDVHAGKLRWTGTETWKPEKCAPRGAKATSRPLERLYALGPDGLDEVQGRRLDEPGEPGQFP